MDRLCLNLVWALLTTGCSDIPPNHDTEARCGCVAEAVRISPVESPVPGTTTIAPCRTFILDREAIGDAPATSCTMPMLCPAQRGGGNTDSAPQINGFDLATAVAHPDVQEALRAGPMRYGAGPDTPDGGGPVYRIGVGQVNFEVAGPCGSEPCTPIPAGVQELMRVLLAVQAQETIRSPCREILSR